jgi:hypothetical protein
MYIHLYIYIQIYINMENIFKHTEIHIYRYTRIYACIHTFHIASLAVSKSKPMIWYDNDGVYSIKITTCGLQNLSPY